MLLGFIQAGREPSAIAGLSEFALLFAGGGVFGYVAGRLLLWCMRHVSGDRLADGTLTLAFAYLSFIAAERLLHVSGVVAVLGAGLTFSALGPSRITPENWSFLSELWEQIAFWARSLIFLLASILVPRLLADVGLHDIVLLSVLIAAAFGARAFVLFVLLSPMERLRLTPRIDLNYKLAIIWGGLRGALTLVLALAITEHSSLPPNIQRFVAVLATGFVLFTLFVNGTTLRLAIRLLGLDRLSARDEALRDHIQALLTPTHATPPVKSAVRTRSRKRRLIASSGCTKLSWKRHKPTRTRRRGIWPKQTNWRLRSCPSPTKSAF